MAGQECRPGTAWLPGCVPGLESCAAAPAGLVARLAGRARRAGRPLRRREKLVRAGCRPRGCVPPAGRCRSRPPPPCPAGLAGGRPGIGGQRL